MRIRDNKPFSNGHVKSLNIRFNKLSVQQQLTTTMFHIVWTGQNFSENLSKHAIRIHKKNQEFLELKNFCFIWPETEENFLGKSEKIWYLFKTNRWWWRCRWQKPSKSKINKKKTFSFHRKNHSNAKVKTRKMRRKRCFDKEK